MLINMRRWQGNGRFLQTNSFAIFIIVLLVLITLIALFTALNQPIYASGGGDWYVDVNSGDDGNDCLTSGTACATIAEAISRANSGDTIFIAAGLYPENLFINGKDLSFVGAGQEATIVDGGGVNRVFYGFNMVLSLAQMTIQNGLATNSIGGGGIMVDGRLIADHITVRHSHATATDAGGGGIRVWGSNTPKVVTITNSLLEQNSSDRGAAIMMDTAGAYVENVAIVNNTVTDVSGAYYQRGNDNTLVNVTISGNSGAGFYASNFAVFTITNGTIVNNSGYGIFEFHGGAMRNTLVADNNGGGENCQHGNTLWFISLGGNLDDGSSCDFDAPSDQTNINPQIGALGNNGGDTLTHALLPGSPAIDAGEDVGCPTTDQRGVARPQDGDGDMTAVCDIGAYELGQIAVTAVTLDGATNGLTDSSYTFVAAIAPATATQPITYTWTATGQSAVVQTSGITDSVTFSWSDTGMKTVEVTADNGLGQAMDSHQIEIQAGQQGMTAVTINGASSGASGQDYTFTANVTPHDATVPITYSWQIEGQSDVVNVGGTSDSVTVNWPDDGEYEVLVTAVNAVNTVTDSHTIILSGWYVDADNGNDNNDCQSINTPCATIGAAADRAPAGSLINIAAGFYHESVMITQSLHFVGAGADVTIWDGKGLGTPLYVSNDNLTTFDVSLSGVTIQNSPERGIYNAENMVIRDIVVKSNDDGGIMSLETLSMTNSIVQNNSTANSGGGLFITGVGRLHNVAIIDNDSPNSAGLHVQFGTAYLTNVTISGQTGSAAVVASNSGQIVALNSTIAHNEHSGTAIYGSMTVQNTILAENGQSNCWVDITSLGHNIEDDDDCSLSHTSDMTDTLSLLEPLADNGGNTLTHALGVGSPAIDAGDNAACPATDQRGIGRPVNAGCDIGAFEADETFPTIYLPFVMR